MIKTSLSLIAVAVASLALCSCNESDNKSKEKAQAGSSQTSPFANTFVNSAPEGALTVGDARKAIGEGKEEIVVKGMLISNGTVFHPSAAMFFVCDDSKIEKSSGGGSHAHEPAQATAHETTCSCCAPPEEATPPAESVEYDWCCTDPAVLKEALLSVQVVDANGKRIPATIKGVSSMTEEARVVIKGTPAPTSTKETPLLNATQIYVIPAK